MPDWSYHTLLRPLLFRLPAERAREVTLGAIGWLAGVPGGTRVIEWLGHMRPPSRLGRTLAGLTLAGPVALGPDLDVHWVATRALAHFGFGFVEVGPVTLEPVRGGRAVERRPDACAILGEDAPVNDGLAAFLVRLPAARGVAVPVGARLAYHPGASAAEATAERVRLIRELAPHVNFVTLDTRWDGLAGGWTPAVWRAHLDEVATVLRAGKHPRPFLVGLPPDAAAEPAAQLVGTALACGAAGVVIGGGLRTPAGRSFGDAERAPTVHLVRALRHRFGGELEIIAGGGIRTPANARRLFDAGASLVEVDAGLVYGGPGLPKRINEAVSYREADPAPRVHPSASWRWHFLLGLGMVVGGLLALLIAATRVVLPYDEAFLGLDRAAVDALNPRLLAFMAHDRVTLAGVMLSIGVLYGGLAAGGVRRGARWARQAIALSGVVGFASFFLYLGYGYFDPLHALVALLLLPLFVFGLRGALPPERYADPDLSPDGRWRAALWGQLLFIVLAIGLAIGGATVAGVGVTYVFVPEDLDFLGTTAVALAESNARLLPVVAHDRAGFGGALVSNGLAVLGASLWGFRRRARWLWWTLCWAGLPGFGAALGVHAVVGYDDVGHLAPVAAALALYAAALALTYPYLCARAPRAGPSATPARCTRPGER